MSFSQPFSAFFSGLTQEFPAKEDDSRATVLSAAFHTATITQLSYFYLAARSFDHETSIFEMTLEENNLESCLDIFTALA